MENIWDKQVNKIVNITVKNKVETETTINRKYRIKKLSSKKGNGSVMYTECQIKRLK